MRENHEKVLGSPGFPARGTDRGQSCAAFFTESRMQFDGTTRLHRKSGFGLHQLRNRSSPSTQCWGCRTAINEICSVVAVFISKLCCKSVCAGKWSLKNLL